MSVLLVEETRVPERKHQTVLCILHTSSEKSIELKIINGPREKKTFYVHGNIFKRFVN